MNTTKRSLRYLLLLACGVSLLGVSCNSVEPGGVYRSLDGADTWEQRVFIGQDGRKTITIAGEDITTLEFDSQDPNIVYAGTVASGLFKSFDGGGQWTQFSGLSSGTVSSIAVHPEKPEVMYVAHRDTILKTKDGGESWENVYTDVKNKVIVSVLIDTYNPKQVYAGTGSGSVVKSYDSGSNWDVRLQAEDAIKEVIIASHDTRQLYAITVEGDMFTTRNGGEFLEDEVGEEGTFSNSGWTELLDKEFRKLHEGAKEAFDIALDPIDTRTVYMVTKRGLMRSVDAGLTWDDVPTLIGFQDKQNEDVELIVVSPKKSNTIYFVVGNAIHKSTDFGDSWQILETFPAPEHKITDLLIDYETPKVLYIGSKRVEDDNSLIP